MKNQEYSSGDILVCLRTCWCYGRQRQAYQGYFYECRGVYPKKLPADRYYSTYSKRDAVVLKEFQCILTKNNFRKATEKEVELYKNGQFSINFIPLIFN